MLTEDPIQVMFNGSVEPMRALVAALRALPIADQFSVAITEYVRARLLAGRRQRRRLLEGHDAGARGCERARLDAGRREAVGDNLNDVEMLDFAGTAYVMGNADRRAQVARLPRDRQQRRGRPGVGRSRVSTM